MPPPPPSVVDANNNKQPNEAQIFFSVIVLDGGGRKAPMLFNAGICVVSWLMLMFNDFRAAYLETDPRKRTAAK